MAIQKATPTNAFNGHGYCVILDEVTDYTKAAIDSILANGFHVGQVFEGSTTPNGDEPSFEDKKDEQGGIIVSDASMGTEGTDFYMADFSVAKLQLFMQGSKITHTASTATSGIAIKGNVVGWGDKLPLIERPVAFFNDKNDQVLIYPKARILCSRVADGKLSMIKAAVRAQSIDTANLKPVMFADKAEIFLTDNTENGD